MLIRTQNLTKIYKLGKGTEIRALVGVNLKIEAGEFISIMGPSGCGKSTLLHLLGCLDTPTAGRYFLEEEEVTPKRDLARLRREKVGFVFQSFNLLPRLSALQNVEMPMIYGGLRPGERRERAKSLLESVGLLKRADHRPSELSGGEQQRVAIARSLANDPQLILADEPTGNLDSRSGKDVLGLLEKLNRERGITLVVVTHDERIAKRAGRITELWDGKVAA